MITRATNYYFLPNLILFGIAILMLVGLTFSHASIAQAAGITVNSLTDDGVGCTLREAIEAANTDSAVGDCSAGSGADTITFAFALTSGGDSTITLTQFDAGTDSDEVGAYALGITSEIIIDGGTGENGITIERASANSDLFRLFYVTQAGDLTLRNLTLTGGSADGGDGGTGGGGAAGMGGAIFVRAGALTIENSTLANHSATGGEGSAAASGGGGGVGADGADGATGDGGDPNGGTGSGNALAIDGGFGGGGGGNLSTGLSVGGDGGFGAGGGGANGGGNGGFGAGSGSNNGLLAGTPGFGGTAGTTTVSGSGGGFGGAIFSNEGTVTIHNSTFANNSATGGTGADGYGGAIFNRNGTLNVNNATISDNSVTTDGGGIYSLGDAETINENDDDPLTSGTPSTATLALSNSIVANSSAGDDVVVNEIDGGTSNSSGVGNLIEGQTGFAGTVASSADPNLSPLADNGGPTDTFAHPDDSPAIDLADDASCEVVDQRGTDRPLGFACDAGAFEREFDIVVTTVDDNFTDDNECTLAEAVANANDTTNGQVHNDCQAGFQSGADTILFAPALTASGDVTITLTNYDTGTDLGEAGPTAFNIFTEITILGATGENGITIARDEGADEFRLFQVNGDRVNFQNLQGNLTLRDLTLRGGVARGGNGAEGGGGAAGLGGAILNRVGTVLLDRVTLVDNIAIGGLGASGSGGGGGGLAGDGGADGTGGAPAGDFGRGGNVAGPAAQPGGGGGSLGGDSDFGGGGGSTGVNGGGTSLFGGETGTLNQGGNGGAFGGAIFNWGEFSSTQHGPAEMTLINTTITGNSVEASGDAGAFGSAIFSKYTKVSLIHTTIVSNTHIGSNTDGMVYVIGSGTGGEAGLNIQNSIIGQGIDTDSALKTADFISNPPTISADSGNNLIDTAELHENSNRAIEEIAQQEAPLLFPLADNGGPTQTFDVMFDSPARNAIATGDCLVATDQRGENRPIDGACEIGSVERDVTPVLAIEKSVDNATPQPNERVTFTIAVNNRGDGDATSPTTVSDILPAELAFVADSVTIDPSGTAGTSPNVATIPTIAAGETVTVTFQADAQFDLIDRDTVITNTATASNADAPLVVSDSVTLTLSSPPGTLVSRAGETTVIDIDDLGAMVITLSRSDDQASIIVNDPDHPVIALAGATQIDNNTASIPFVTSPRQTFNVLGSLGDDTLIFDHTNGLTIPNQSDVNYDGGPEDTADGDSFRSIGQNNSSSHSYTFIDDSSGTIEYGGTTINYIGLEPVYVDTNTASLTLTLGESADLATITDLGNEMANIDGATLETTDFGLPLGSSPMLVELGAGDDTLMIESLVLDGKTRLTLNGEEGDDEILWKIGRSSVDTERIRVTSADFTFDPATSHSVILRGTGQGDTYDQIRMTNNNTITLNIPLDLSLGNGFVPSPLDSFTIIEMEDAAGVVSGTFNGYPEDHAFELGGVPFRITYTGGDGNDVVLFVPNLVVSTESEEIDGNTAIGENSIREAIAAAVDGDTVTFDNSISGGTITLSAPVVVSKNITISGTVPITVDGDNSVRVFEIDDNATVTIDQLNITNGRSTDGEIGASIRVFAGSDLTLLGSNVTNGTNTNTNGGGIGFEAGSSGTVRGSAFVDNSATAASGGAITLNSGATVSIINSTFSGNMAGQFGGAIVNNAGTLTINNVTSAENSAGNNGSGLATSGGSTQLNNAIFADSAGGSNCLLATAPTGDNNLSDDSSCGTTATQVADMLLGARANHADAGSSALPTQTYSLLPNSPALESGAACAVDDQRGIVRPQLASCDVGAFESQGFTISSTGGGGQTTLIDTPFTNPLTLTLTANDNNALTAGGQLFFTAPMSGASIDTTPITATIGADGAVSINVTANGTIGSYDVTATTPALTGGDATYTLTNATLGYSVEDASVIEGDSGTSDLNFVVRRNTNALAGTVDFVTIAGSAENGSDFTAVTTTVSFTAGGSLTQTVTVLVNGEEIVEANEELSAEISNPSIGTIDDPTAKGIIVNDDTTSINFGGTVSGLEGSDGNDRTFNYFFTSSKPVQGGFAIEYSTNDFTAFAGSDYIDNDGIITFTGSASEQQNFQVTIIGDNVVESDDEQFVLRLDAVTATTLQDSIIPSRDVLTATILSEDIGTVTLSGGAALPEGNAGTVTHVFTATLNNAVDGGFDVAYTTDDGSAIVGSDYVDSDGTLSFAGNVGESKTIFVDVTGDTVLEADETFEVNLGAFSNSDLVADLRTANSPQTGTITNDDSATLSISDGTTGVETDSGIIPTTVTVTLSADVQGGTSVTYASISDTASAADGDFNGFGGQTLTFAGNAGETQTITVELRGDTKVEADEMFTIEIREPTNGVTIEKAAAPFTIINDDSTTVTLTGNPSADEGDLLDGTTPLEFTVTVADRVQGGFDIAYSTIDGTATADDDYDGSGSTVNIPEFGSLSQTFTVDVNGDNTIEADETFEVMLGALSNLGDIDPNDITVEMTTGVGTILNDDGVAFSITDASVIEGDGGAVTMVFTVTADGDIVGTASVDYTTQDGSATTADGDYDADSGSFLFTPTGTRSRTVEITINGDTQVEGDEAFSVLLENVQGIDAVIADGEGIGTIVDDDTAQLAIGDATVIEGDSGPVSATFTVTLTGDVSGGTTVDFATSDNTATAGSDYDAASGQLSFAGTSGETQTVEVTINGDTAVEATETFSVTLSAPTNGATITDGDGVGTIENDDTATITLTGGTTKVEGDGGTVAYQFTATLDNEVDGGVMVAYTTDDGSATAGSDYIDNDNSLAFAGNAGETQTITVRVNGDTTVEADETFSVSLGAVSSALASDVSTAGSPQSGTITDDDTATVTLMGGATQAEGDSGTTDYTFTVLLDAAVQGGLTVDFTTNDGTATVADSDYVDNDSTLSFAGTAGEMKTIVVQVNGDTKVENNETFTVALGATSNGAVTTAGTPQQGGISNDDSATVTLSGGTTQAEGDSGTTSFTFTATLDNAVDSGFDLAYLTDDGTATVADSDYVDNDGTLSFAGTAGEQQMITVLVNGDSKTENDETFSVALGGFSNVGVSGGDLVTTGTPQTGTIDNDDIAFIISDAEVVEGDSGTTTLLFTVTLKGEAAGLTTVEFATQDGTATTADGDYSANSGTLNFTGAADETNTVSVQVNGDIAVEANETLTVLLSNASAGVEIEDPEGVGTIFNDDGATLSIGDVTVNENGTATIVVTMNTTNVNPVTVEFATSDDSATAPADYADTTGTVTIAAGQTTGTADIALNDDALDENDETFNVTLSNPNGATIADGAGVVTITDNDNPPTVSVSGATVAEADGASVEFTITLSPVSGLDVVVEYTTADGSAEAGSDYVAKSGSVTIPAGQTQAIVAVMINNDDVAEDSETFSMTLSNPTNATLGTSSANSTITDDEVASVTITPETANISENGSETFVVTLSAEPSSPVTITFASQDTGECVSAVSSVVLDSSNWDTGASFDIEGVQDSEADGNQSCTVTVDADTNAAQFSTVDPDDLTVTILDTAIPTAIALSTQHIGAQAVAWQLASVLFLLTLCTAAVVRREQR